MGVSPQVRVAIFSAALLACRPSAAPSPSLPAADASPPLRTSTSADEIATDAGDAQASQPPTVHALTFQDVALPNAAAPASVDYIAYESVRDRVWVPVGNTGSVDVFDIAARRFSVVAGFRTAERDMRGRKRTVGPSAVSIGNGVAYVGNRATREVCVVDTNTLQEGHCFTLPAETDGVVYVAGAKEVWVTMPRSHAIAVLDASVPETLKMKSTIAFDGAPEGYAVDESRGLFFTNLEDVNKTVVVDVSTHQLAATWTLDCGSEGPRGLAVDQVHAFVYVACTDHVVVLDGARNGSQVAAIDTGAGVDNIDWVQSRRLLYVAAAKAAKFTIARIDANGYPTVVAAGATVLGARNGVADAKGNAYVTDAVHARLLVFAFAP